MAEMGPLRSCDTACTKSSFICWSSFSSVMSRSTAAAPTVSPYGVTTGTTVA